MARPPKPEGERRSRRLTVYLDKQEAETLESLSEATQTDKTKIVIAALKHYTRSMAEPPEPLRRARQEAIMQQDTEQISGFVCSNGHTFWLEAVWPAPPRRCPACGTDSIKATWGGTARRGF